MREISVSEFRQQCLALMDHLPPEGILITRHGTPVAQLVPVRRACGDLIGTVPVLTSDPDDLFSTGEQWEADAES
jgi:antitoxin (DNA-binding transcriptional repressor) of toxin-antitoxin stability system